MIKSREVLLCYGLIAVVGGLILFPSIFFPFVRDQSSFAYAGSLIVKGGVPYRDVWDLKPPGLFLIYAAFAWFTDSDVYDYMVAVHSGDVLFTITTALLLTWIGRRSNNAVAGFGAALWYVVLFYHWGYLAYSQAEAWSNLFLVGACALSLYSAHCTSTKETDGRKTISFFTSGILCGCVITVKYVLIPACFPFVAYGLYRSLKRWKHISILLFGIFSSISFVIGWLYLQGGLNEFIEIQRQFILPHATVLHEGSIGSVKGFLNAASHIIRDIWLPLTLACIGLILYAFRRSHFTHLILVSLCLAMVVVLIQNKFYGYHWVTTLPWIALAAGIGTSVLFSLVRINPLLQYIMCLLFPLAWLVSKDGIKDMSDGYRYGSGHLTKQEWYERFAQKDDYNFLAIDSIATYVRKNSRPDDKIVVWGFEPLIYLLADRQSASRFINNGALRVSYTQQLWRAEFMNDVKQKKPSVILVSTDDVFWSLGLYISSAQNLRDWSELNNWLLQYYHRVPSIGSFDIYRHN